MFPGLKKVILQLGPKLHGQEPDPAGFWKEVATSKLSSKFDDADSVS